MRMLDLHPRILRLINSAIEKLSLELNGITVLTEAASGPFIVTPLISALAGAEKTYAVIRSSQYGSFKEVEVYLELWRRYLNIPRNRITTITDAHDGAKTANIITNLGFVRPIDKELITSLPLDACVSLMWETWEFRDIDVDLNACRSRNIPVLGTKETDRRLNIFRYVGMTVLKLLLEANIECFNSRILIISNDIFGTEISNVLRNNDADVLLYISGCGIDRHVVRDFLKSADAVIVAEQISEECLIGGDDTLIPCEWLKDAMPCVIHISGVVDDDMIERMGIRKYPPKRVSARYMTVTTDYVGVKPVIDLHAAGLRVGQLMVEGMRKYNDAKKATEYALANSPAMDFPNI